MLSQARTPRTETPSPSAPTSSPTGAERSTEASSATDPALESETSPTSPFSNHPSPLRSTGETMAPSTVSRTRSNAVHAGPSPESLPPRADGRSSQATSSASLSNRLSTAPREAHTAPRAATVDGWTTSSPGERTTDSPLSPTTPTRVTTRLAASTPPRLSFRPPASST